jgi:acyl-coenzyme A thioesterase PaaI-like protein
MKPLPHTHGCFVCGDSNPKGLNLRFETDGRIVRGRFLPQKEFVGFRDTMHGGLVATLLDEIMVWACAVQTKRFGFCAEMTIRFLQPVRPGEEIIVEAELTANRRNRIFEAKSEARTQSGQVLAMATGKYMPVKTDDISAMVTDFVGDTGFFEAGPSNASQPPKP